MSDSTKAVFLSYASQDAEAVSRIAEALRAAGVEVWFDKNELVGGDAWDQKIRRQIKDCALFVPVISANTNARAEGYFRLEWKLAVDRSHLMADDAAFLFPVVIDDTTDAAARVPDRFRDFQWTRLSGKDTPESLAIRIGKLLSSGVEPVSDRLPARGAGSASGKKSQAPFPRYVWPLVGIGFALIFALKPLWSPSRARPEKPAAPLAPAAAPVSETQQLASRARQLYRKSSYTREDLALAVELAGKATELSRDSADAWGALAWAHATYLARNWDFTDTRRRATEIAANRALSLDSANAEAHVALGHLFRIQGAHDQAEAEMRRALALAPEDKHVVRAFALILARESGNPERRALLQKAVERDPRDPLLRYDLAQSFNGYSGRGDSPVDLEFSLAQLDAGLAIEPIWSLCAAKAAMLVAWRGDLAGMRAALNLMETRPLAERTEDRAVFVAMWGALLERDEARLNATAALTVKNYFDDSIVTRRPKDWMLAVAHQHAGKENLARLAWQRAETVLRQRLRTDPDSPLTTFELATTLAWLERTDEATRLIAPIEGAWREDSNLAKQRALAHYYAAAGDAARALPYLRQALDSNVFLTRQTVPLDPWWDKIRSAPEIKALFASPR